MISSIFLDIDGVLADFRKQCENYDCIKGTIVNWDIVNSAGTKFWEEIEWSAEGKQFFKWIKQICDEENIDLFILTAVKGTDAKTGRFNWIKKHIGLDRHHIIIVNSGKEKAYYAEPTALLIDDFSKNCSAFINAGGQAVQFKAMDQAKNKITEILSL